MTPVSLNGVTQQEDADVAAILDDTSTTLDGLLKQKDGRKVISSAVQASVVLPISTSAADQALPSVVVTSGLIPPNAVITRAVVALSWRKATESSAGANAIVAAAGQHIDVDITGGFATTAILLVDNTLAMTASEVAGSNVLVGFVDIKAEVADGSTTTFQWSLAGVDAASITLHDVVTHLIIEYE